MHEGKKQEERRILDLIYGGRAIHSVESSERPDFLLRLSADTAQFGVEITRLYESETEARLQNIDGYVTALLGGEAFRHREDIAELTVGKIDLERDGRIHAEQIPAIIRPVLQPGDSARIVAELIQSKAEQLRHSSTPTRHLNLIIDDKTDSLRALSKADFYSAFFVPELVEVLSKTAFREVFLVTTFEEVRVYAALRMLLLMGSAYRFDAAVMSKDRGKRLIETGTDRMNLFASYYSGQSGWDILVRKDHDGTEAILGDSGLLVQKDGKVLMRTYHDTATPEDAVPPTLEWSAVLGHELSDELEDLIAFHSFSTEAMFPVSK